MYIPLHVAHLYLHSSLAAVDLSMHVQNKLSVHTQALCICLNLNAITIASKQPSNCIQGT